MSTTDADHPWNQTGLQQVRGLNRLPGGFSDDWDRVATTGSAPVEEVPEVPGPGGEHGPADSGSSLRVWRRRIVRRYEAHPGTLKPHPDNYKEHPGQQRDAIAATIAEVGWIGEIYVSSFSGRILDGHARVTEAIGTGQPSIPVAVIDCEDEADEARVLATFNTLGQMSRQDDGKLLELVNRADFADGRDSTVVRALAGLVGNRKTKAEPAGRIIGSAFGPQGGGRGGKLGKVGDLIYPLVVECTDGAEQDRLLEALLDEGHAAYAMDAAPSSIGDRQLHGVMEPGQPGDLGGSR